MKDLWVSMAEKMKIRADLVVNLISLLLAVISTLFTVINSYKVHLVTEEFSTEVTLKAASFKQVCRDLTVGGDTKNICIPLWTAILLDTSLLLQVLVTLLSILTVVCHKSGVMRTVMCVTCSVCTIWHLISIVTIHLCGGMIWLVVLDGVTDVETTGCLAWLLGSSLSQLLLVYVHHIWRWCKGREVYRLNEMR